VALKQNAKQADTIVNIITCSQHLNKPAEYANRYLTYVSVLVPLLDSRLRSETNDYPPCDCGNRQLKSIAPNHPYVSELAKHDAAFDELAARFASR
jgi:hypothetical protein